MNKIKILITTDNHLGYKEKCPNRTNDSFENFYSVLKTTHSPDIILLLGDLFHTSNPSLTTLNKCIDIMQKTISQKKLIKNNFINLQNPNSYKVNKNSIPTILIHGNHDKPIGGLDKGPLDILEKAGYITYIGKNYNLADFDIRPFVVRKGKTVLAFYPVSYIKDEKLNFLLESGKIKFLEEEKFSLKILILHQNRFKGFKNGVPAKNSFNISLLPRDFFDLILWGHEHEAFSAFIDREEFNLKIYQPGSTVGTSLKTYEAIEKRYGILEIEEEKMILETFLVENQRKMIVDDLDVEKYVKSLKDKKEIESKLVTYVKNKYNLCGFEKKPLLRLKLLNLDGDLVNLMELEIRIKDFVANWK